MSVLNKVEGGYLQLLRVLVLAMATLVLVCAAIFGARALMNYNAKPKAVSEDIAISAASFHLGSEPEEKEAEGDGKSDVHAAEHAKLADSLLAVIKKHGKALAGPTFEVDKTEVHNFVEAALGEEDLGEKFVATQTAYIDQVFARADVVKHVKNSETFYETLNKAFGDYRKAYLAEKERISGEKAVAEGEASSKQVEAAQSIYLIGALFSAFILLVLLIVLIRIERSIRSISVGKPAV